MLVSGRLINLPYESTIHVAKYVSTNPMDHRSFEDQLKALEISFERILADHNLPGRFREVPSR